MIRLSIDTAKMNEVVVELTVDKKKFQLLQKHEKGSQIVLSMIEELIEKNGINLSDIEKIYVNQGPGSYTGVRVGVSIANALAFTLQVPINNLPVGQFVEPKYE